MVIDRKVYKDIYRYLYCMRKIEVTDNKFILNENVEIIYEKRVTPFGTSAKVDAPKKYRGWRAYVIIVKD